MYCKSNATSDGGKMVELRWLLKFRDGKTVRKLQYDDGECFKDVPISEDSSIILYTPAENPLMWFINYRNPKYRALYIQRTDFIYYQRAVEVVELQEALRSDIFAYWKMKPGGGRCLLYRNEDSNFVKVPEVWDDVDKVAHSVRDILDQYIIQQNTPDMNGNLYSHAMMNSLEFERNEEDESL